MLSATIVIPFHNEKENLEILSNELLNALENKPKDIDVSVIFVNDNSDDGGDIYISKFINKLENFKIINLEKRSGQTGAFKKLSINVRQTTSLEWILIFRIILKT